MLRARLIIAMAGVAMVLAMGGAAQGAGFLVPTDESIPPLAIKYLRVDTTIDNQVATTHVTQEFQNSTNRQLECTYIFPLPKGAAIRDFSMYINGKREKGELVEKDKARAVFEEIVRRARDPGLLEYVDNNILKMRVFPVPANGTQKIEIEYSEMISMDGGLAEYVFPLKIGAKASRTLDDFTMAVRIKSPSAIKTVYSPTYEIGVAHPSEHEAVAGMESKGAVLDRDFQLFYTVGEKDFGLSLMTYRPDPDQPGMFVMLLAPKSEINAADRMPRDLVLVLDTSGSMRGTKLDQAKKALAFCLEKLEKKDRFAIVQFSTSAETFADGWTDATPDNLKKASEWVNKFEAAGGTSIAGALGKVFALKYEDARPATVFFVTDGQPTVDVTDPDTLAKTVKENNKRNLRMFTFGVGDDVNAKLLDRMAADTGGLPEYVRDGEGIDAKITRLAAKMTHPVLTGLSVEVTRVKVAEMFPKDLPDLFRGGQIVIVGSYTGDGPAAVRLRGSVGSKKEEFVYEETFPKKATERSFIGAVYAQRKIGFLLDQIRLHGENKELKDEVVRLSVAYGIQTPYTSFLVLENDQQYKQYGIERRKAEADNVAKLSGGAIVVNNGADASITMARSPMPMAPAKAGVAGEKRFDEAASREQSEAVADKLTSTFSVMGVGGGGGRDSAAPPASATPSVDSGTLTATGSTAEPRARTEGEAKNEDARRTKESGDREVSAWRQVGAEEFQKAQAGKTAVDIAQNVLALRLSEGKKFSDSAQPVQVRGGRSFANFRGVWVDERFTGAEQITKIKWGSEAYFNLLRTRPELKEILTLGEQVVVVTAKGKAVAVDSNDGSEKLTDDVMKTLFVDVAEVKPAETAPAAK
jgi:Ca-activated chloride channel homolog